MEGRQQQQRQRHQQDEPLWARYDANVYSWSVKQRREIAGILIANRIPVGAVARVVNIDHSTLRYRFRALLLRVATAVAAESAATVVAATWTGAHRQASSVQPGLQHLPVGIDGQDNVDMGSEGEEGVDDFDHDEPEPSSVRIWEEGREAAPADVRGEVPAGAREQAAPPAVVTADPLALPAVPPTVSVPPTTPTPALQRYPPSERRTHDLPDRCASHDCCQWARFGRGDSYVGTLWFPARVLCPDDIRQGGCPLRNLNCRFSHGESDPKEVLEDYIDGVEVTLAICMYIFTSKRVHSSSSLLSLVFNEDRH